MGRRDPEARKKYMVWYTSEARRKLKLRAIEYKGGKCILCGYAKCPAALQFHHIDDVEKEFGISSGDTRSWEKLRVELDKTILVCANCHHEAHHAETERLRVQREADLRLLIPPRHAS